MKTHANGNHTEVWSNGEVKPSPATESYGRARYMPASPVPAQISRGTLTQLYTFAWSYLSTWNTYE